MHGLRRHKSPKMQKARRAKKPGGHLGVLRSPRVVCRLRWERNFANVSDQPGGPVPRETDNPALTRIENRLFILQGTLQRFEFAAQPFDLPSQIVLLAAFATGTEIGVPDIRTTVLARPEIGAVGVGLAILPGAEIGAPGFRTTLAAGTEVGVPSLGSMATARASGGLATIRTAVVLSIEAAGASARTPLGMLPVLPATVELGMVPMLRATLGMGMMPMIRTAMGMGVVPMV